MTRFYGDENLIPANGPQKTIHQRNKSSPALSSLAQTGGLKAAAKRTAFGDVSNTSNLARPSKDDSIVGAKAGYADLEKPVTLQQDKKSAALLRPAQRPLSVSGVKNFLNVISSSSQAAIKHSRTEVQESVYTSTQVANTRKTLTKRNTSVFKDHAHAQPNKSQADLLRPTPAAIQPALAELPVAGPEEKSGEEVERQHKVRRTNSNIQVEVEEKGPGTNLPESSEEAESIRSDGIYIDNNGEIQVYQYPTEDDQETGLNIIPRDDGVPLAEAKMSHHEISSDQVVETYEEPPQPELTRKHRLTSVSEPEEYWDEDEEEENYDEEGYVTARSYKSRGENTINGATTILFPKMNQRVKRELAAAKELIESTKAADEYSDETWDTTMVAEYGDEIFQYMKDLEVSHSLIFRNHKSTNRLQQIRMLPNPHYMDNQAEIQWSMRSVLMDWLVQVHHRFSLLPETLFLCVNYIDRFLSCKIVSLGKLQLVGATAIFVAAKYEEINCPSVQEIVYMVDGGYTVDEILKAERFMLSMLQFELGWPGPMSFLRRISKADDYDLETRTLAKYFLEVTIMDERFVGSPPSFAAAGAHCLARMMLQKGHWVRES